MLLYNNYQNMANSNNSPKIIDVLSNKVLGTLLFGLRMTAGWMFFSAFLRRVILAPEKLDPTSIEYVGHKFNHFLPHAVGIKPMLEWLLTNPEILFIFLIVFTIIEGLCGLGLIFGFFTRLTALGSACLSFGILLGAGWLGTTCLDEWQIGCTGTASGIALMLFGSGCFSLDNLFFKDKLYDGKHRWLVWLTSGTLPVKVKTIKYFGFWFGLLAMFITLWSNQVIHGGVWGKLHNYAKSPKIEILDANINNGYLNFEMYRINGPDTYGAFIIEVKLIGSKGDSVWEYDFAEHGLDNVKNKGISVKNEYLVKIKPSKYSLEVPLGGKGLVSIKGDGLEELSSGKYKLELLDVSGDIWSYDLEL